MEDYKKRLQKIFNTRVTDCWPLAGNSFGLGFSLWGRESANLVPFFHRSAENGLSDFVNECGVMVIRNARVMTLPTHKTSEALNARGKLQQDPFHIDYAFDTSGDPKISALYSRTGGERSVPTYYADAKDVRAAITELAARNQTLSTEITAAMNAMAQPRYYFSSSSYESAPRELVEKLFPEFTRRVYDLLPEARKYAHYWYAGERTVVLHSNRAGHILHGRPESNEDDDPQLNAVLF